MWSSLTSSLTIGSRMVVVATLLVNVVNVVPTRTRIRTTTTAGNELNTDRDEPSTFDRPDTYTATPRVLSPAVGSLITAWVRY